MGSLLALFISFALSLSQAATERPLRVLTLNVFIGKAALDPDRIQRQAKKVQALDPDLICLQEAWDPRIAEIYSEHLTGHSPILGWKKTSDKGLQGIVGELGIALSVGYYHDDPLVSRDSVGKWVYADRLGVALLYKPSSGLSFERDAFVEFDTDAAPSIPTSILRVIKSKGALGGRFKYRDKPLFVGGFHLSNGVENPMRIGEVAELNNWALRERDPDGPAILCGDSNADGEQPEMKWLRESVEAGWSDSYLDKNPDLTRAPHHGATWDNANSLTRGNLTEPNQRVDYVLTLSGARHRIDTLSSRIVLDECTTGLTLSWGASECESDHYGVLSELTLH